MRATLRTAYQRLVPLAVRRRLRIVLREAPLRLRDLRADLADAMGRRDAPLPPARLRASVGIDSSRAHFLDVGRRALVDLTAALATAGVPLESLHDWLDFGCGSGRVARHVVAIPTVNTLTGIDVDDRAIRWCAGHLPGVFHTIAPQPPTALADASYDIVYAVSVFTHFDERQQLDWLAELQRLLRPNGILLVTTHPTSLVHHRPDLTEAHHAALAESGFTFKRGTIGFNDDSAFHTRDYMERVWSQWFRPVRFLPGGLAGYHDISIWRR